MTFTYDKDGRLSTDATSGPGTGQPTVTLTYGYDQAGDETSVTDSLSSQGITTYGYDAAQRLTTIAASYGGTAGPQVVFNYDPANRLTSILRTNAANGPSGTTVATTLVYDNANRLTTITDEAYTTFGTVTYNGLATYVYNYDNANRATSRRMRRGQPRSPMITPTN